VHRRHQCTTAAAAHAAPSPPAAAAASGGSLAQQQQQQQQQQIHASEAWLQALRERLQLHNTMSRKKEHFAPRPALGDRVQMYVCGVTVYDYSHIGEPCVTTA
jgi:cysteinyl-tRNA synthetase